MHVESTLSSLDRHFYLDLDPDLADVPDTDLERYSLDPDLHVPNEEKISSLDHDMPQDRE
jgi:hypothetical protein